MRIRRLVCGGLLAGTLLTGERPLAEEPGRRSGRPGPPREAIEACSGQQEGANCSFTIDGNQLTGTCRAGPAGLPAACFPRGGPPGPHRGPPPEAVQACSGMKEGEACAVTLDGNTLDGVCRSGPEGGSLACLPTKPPSPR
jgi:hypothetical protein